MPFMNSPNEGYYNILSEQKGKKNDGAIFHFKCKRKEESDA